MSIGAPLIGLTQLMTMQATIQRNQTTRDAHGAKLASDWETISTSACFLWWGTGAVVTRVGSIQQHAEADVDLDTGGMVMPAGTDVTPRDRIAQVLDASEAQVAGLLEVLAVAEYLGATEVSFRRLS